ncbi:hypothetical protein BRARA_C03139 [Brassica rapa]|uniref:BnaA03g57380D protein n=4 Tax=Brassica TaxID=3705 RepID=A0A078J5Q9_BRANA|nr:uncharacterized protein LOC106443928 [Brassica napus]KAG5405455.1 hypothetical protein IGI04_011574 [Brassica rapa subsp. trilocularis]RID71187.1 hypothetical protein BRARA_C03139 [Brassica rapa]KAH0933898.1 hypothetical protein HID58_011015 [Brassica napus]CAF2126450.1 unnamed protein product [Brassica napus]CAG7882120.1 unnamed protein product [Brassica rapa]
MAMDLELDDDVFFADISKQINLLITDEDEQNPISLSSSVFQGLLRENYQTSATPFKMYHEQNYIARESKGTGVFIPRCSQPRRKQHNHPRQKKQGSAGSFISKQQFSHHVYDNNYTTLNNNQERVTLHHAPSTNSRRAYRDAASLFT